MRTPAPSVGLPPRLYVKPAEGRLVRRPGSFRPLRPEGEDVTGEAAYFHRLLRAGDVVRVDHDPRQQRRKSRPE